MNETDKFLSGYVCAVCVLIQLNGEVNTTTRELYKAGVGNLSLEYLKNRGIDEQDIKTLKQYWKELK